VFQSQTQATGGLQWWYDSLAGAPSGSPAYTLTGYMQDGLGHIENFSGYMVELGNGWSYLDVGGANYSQGYSPGQLAEFKGWVSDGGFWAAGHVTTASWGWNSYGQYDYNSTTDYMFFY